jgi:hypothetical protein
MTLRAKFLGENKSLGYRKNSEYRILIERNMVIPLNSNCLNCPYTLEGFLKNWSVIEVLAI